MPSLPASDAPKVELWAIRLDQPQAAVDRLSVMLDVDELQRAATFHFDRDRHRWIVARASLRRLLARRLGINPEEVFITVEEGGKPALDTPGHNLEFNLAHSGDWALVALSNQGVVGVDLEPFVRGRELEECVSVFLGEGENARWMALDDVKEKAKYLIRVWCAKEAALKASGVGLSIAPTTLNVRWNRAGALLSIGSDEEYTIHFPEGFPDLGFCATVALPAEAVCPDVVEFVP